MVQHTGMFLVGACCAGLLACGGGDEPETPQQPQPQYMQPGQQQPGQYPAQQQPGQYPAQQQQQPAPAQPGAVPPDPNQPQPQAQPGQAQPGTLPGAPPVAPPPSAGTQAQAVDPSLAAPVQTVLNQMATTEAPGAKPVGSVIAGNFQQGQSMQVQVQMQPGKCYTVLGAALPPVSEVNLQLTAVTPIPGLSSPILAQDQTTGLQAILGQKPNCYKWAWPVSGAVNVVLTVAGGTGLAAAQVYEK